MRREKWSHCFGEGRGLEVGGGGNVKGHPHGKSKR